jgi:hypothetical protein
LTEALLPPYLLPTLLGLITGLVLYLILINRILSFLDKGLKTFVSGFGFVFLVGGSCLFGYLSSDSAWVLALILMIALLALGEARSLLIRRRQRGSQPVARTGLRVTLSRPITTTDLQVYHFVVPTPFWRGKRIRVVHLSDLHVNSHVPQGYYQEVIEQANRAQPDLVFFTGDFITDIHCVDLLPTILQKARSRFGIYAILGNHDYWADAKQVSEVVSRMGFHLLHNNWQRLQLNGQGSLLIQGCEDPWSPDKWSAAPVQPGELALVLSHTADNIYRLSEAGAAAVFSGHYHAGQFKLPGFGPIIVPSKYGRRFDHGHFVVNGTHLFVSAGVGAAEPPLRIYCPPDIFIIDFTGKAEPGEENLAS